MKTTKYSFLNQTKPFNQPRHRVQPVTELSQEEPKPTVPPGIRTTAHEYANPVDYQHPNEAMARFAIKRGFLKNGRGLPYSTTLRDVAPPRDIPPGLGLRQPSGALGSE